MQAPNEREEWLQAVLGSLDGGVRPAEPSPFLYARLRERLREKRIGRISAVRAWLALASLLLLAVLNWRVVRQADQATTTTTAAAALVQDYGLTAPSAGSYDLFAQ